MIKINFKKYGFSLIEVLIGLVILAVFIIPVFDTLTTTHKGTVLLKDDVNAILLGLELIDQVKIIPLKYINGIGKIQIKDNEQPLIKFFKKTPIYKTIKSSKEEIRSVKALLTLELSPLPPGYERILELEKQEGFFAKVHVIIKYPFINQRKKKIQIVRKISGIMVGGK